MIRSVRATDVVADKAAMQHATETKVQRALHACGPDSGPSTVLRSVDTRISATCP
jgi:hypothetical protein